MLMKLHDNNSCDNSLYGKKGEIGYDKNASTLSIVLVGQWSVDYLSQILVPQA